MWFEDFTELFDIGCDGQFANKNEFNYESSPESKHVGIKTAEWVVVGKTPAHNYCE